MRKKKTCMQKFLKFFSSSPPSLNHVKILEIYDIRYVTAEIMKKNKSEVKNELFLASLQFELFLWLLRDAFNFIWL